MSLDGIGGRQRAGGYGDTGAAQRVGPTPSQAGQAGQAEGAAGAGAVGGIDIPKVAGDIAKSLGAAADKFKMLSGVNPFSQKAGMMMDMLSKGHEAIKEALDDWGKSIREQAEKDKTAHLEDQVKKQQVGPQFTKSAPGQTNPANLAE